MAGAGLENAVDGQAQVPSPGIGFTAIGRLNRDPPLTVEREPA